MLEAGTHLIESIPVITAAVGLFMGAVRIIPLNGFKLEVIDSMGNKAKSRITGTGHAIVPDGGSASIGLYIKGGGLKTLVNVMDDPETSQAIITGINKNHLSTLSYKKQMDLILEKNLIVKYLYKKRDHQSKR